MPAAVWSAAISGVCTIIAALIYKNVRQVHQMVNSRLDTALLQIEDLKSERGIARGDTPPGETDERLARPADKPRPRPSGGHF
jgi:hypothetical protein